ncbi:MAG: acyl carrier protein [Anaerovoracaceae bacterium]
MIRELAERNHRHMREKVIEILTGIRSDIDFENSTKLIDDGMLESIDIVSIVGELNDEFDIEISVEDLLPENFNSVDAMVDLITRAQE